MIDSVAILYGTRLVVVVVVVSTPGWLRWRPVYPCRYIAPPRPVRALQTCLCKDVAHIPILSDVGETPASLLSLL